VSDAGWLLLLAVLVVGYLNWTASRLDRLHARVEGARAALDAQLLRRSSVCLELATSGLLDPASSVLLAEAAHEARAAEEPARQQAESDLTAALGAALPDDATVEMVREEQDGRELLGELEAAIRRVQLARRFHNDAVRATQAVRRRRLVRYLRLAGRAGRPSSFEADDTPPRGLDG
jgi:hypothetical protein